MKLDILGLAEMFLDKEEEVCVAGYEWYGWNREGCRWASVGIGILADKKLRSQKLEGSRRGLMWVECEVEGGKKVAVGIVYIYPEGVRVQEIGVFQSGVTMLEGKEYEVILIGDFNMRIELGEKHTLTIMEEWLLHLVCVGELTIGNEMNNCEGKWTREVGEKKSVIDYCYAN